MDNFRTIVQAQPTDFRLDHNSKVFCIGSCFAQNIAAKLADAGFRVTTNPLGVMYNPLSIADTLNRLATAELFGAYHIRECGDVWCNFATHGSLSAATSADAMRAMNNAVISGSKALREATHVIITLGTAWVYTLPMGDIVANCHKFPASYFLRRRLLVHEIEQALGELMNGALAGKKVLLTVSPIRHLKDGAHQNTISKATLALATESLTGRNAAQCSYFPAYEIMMDDLRDYRFYDSDMTHPSATAIDYIWQQFESSVMSAPTRKLITEIATIKQAAAHRPFNPHTEAHLAFCSRMLERIDDLETRHGEIDLSKEREYFNTISNVK